MLVLDENEMMVMSTTAGVLLHRPCWHPDRRAGIRWHCRLYTVSTSFQFWVNKVTWQCKKLFQLVKC